MSPDKDTHPDTGDGPPPDLRAENPLIRSIERAVDKLESARSYIERDLREGRDDVKGILDRLARLETKVSDLPSKVWIGGVVVAGAGIVIAALTLIINVVKGH